MSHPDILILVGTQTGNSEVVAEVVAEELGEAGFTCHVVDMAEAYPEMLAGYRQLVVVMCTWAEGTFPDNTVEFYDALVAVKPDLSELSFGMIGLGDHDYDPFYLTANYKLVETLSACGAASVIEILDIDGTPKPRHLEAARSWARKAAEAFAAAG
ncbi:MAG: flavodoxin domain-containing protein [Bacteroidetes bacterium]|nr:flavodoxin domain-containing protein [Bacteroidota bacterium]